MIHITLAHLLKRRAEGYPLVCLLKEAFGPNTSTDDPLPISDILDRLGLDDALECLALVDDYESEKRLLSVFAARKVEHLLTDSRSLIAIDVAERFAKGEATVQELIDAEDGAEAAVSLSAFSIGVPKEVRYACQAAWWCVVSGRAAVDWCAWNAMRALPAPERELARAAISQELRSILGRHGN